MSKISYLWPFVGLELGIVILAPAPYYLIVIPLGIGILLAMLLLAMLFGDESK